MAVLRQDITAKISRNGIYHLVRRSGMTYGALKPSFRNLSSIETKI
jgi:hypothetical protein